MASSIKDVVSSLESMTKAILKASGIDVEGYGVQVDARCASLRDEIEVRIGVVIEGERLYTVTAFSGEAIYAARAGGGAERYIYEHLRNGVEMLKRDMAARLLQQAPVSTLRMNYERTMNKSEAAYAQYLESLVPRLVPPPPPTRDDIELRMRMLGYGQLRVDPPSFGTAIALADDVLGTGAEPAPKEPRFERPLDMEREPKQQAPDEPDEDMIGRWKALELE